ncbi:HlyD family secretion protein [Falsiroseomonas sp. HW251]|uniref:HlyD family secretion protein n=1 Tax=Falsiroseomonas sp. HW251 TaxID=3390998 RepID=UPI003D31A45C
MNAISPESRTKEAPRDGLLSPVGPAEPLPRKSLFRRLRPFLLLIALAAAAVGGTWWWTTARFLMSTDNATIAGDIAVLSSRIEGDVAEILVTDNQRVQAGQPLIRLEQQDWQARLAQAEANVAESEAAIATFGEQIAQQRAQVTAAEAQVASAEAERQRAATDAARAQELVRGNYASRQSVDQAVADLRKAEAAVAANQAQLAVQRQALPVLEANRRQAEARRLSAIASRDLAKNALDYTVIRAPFEGIVGNRAAQLGQHVRAGQQLIAVAPPPERQWVLANFKETQLTRMRVGQPVIVTVDALPGLELRGRVESLAPATGSLFSLLPPENATGNFTKIVQRVPVRVAIAPEDTERLALLRPGLSVEAEVDTRENPDAPRGVFGAAAATVRGLFDR